MVKDCGNATVNASWLVEIALFRVVKEGQVAEGHVVYLEIASVAVVSLDYPAQHAADAPTASEEFGQHGKIAADTEGRFSRIEDKEGEMAVITGHLAGDDGGVTGRAVSKDRPQRHLGNQ